MSNEKKYCLCRKFSRVLGGIAIFLIGIGMSIETNDSMLPVAVMIGSGTPFALLSFILEKYSYYFKREAKKDKEIEQKKKLLRKLMFSADYTKISA